MDQVPPGDGNIVLSSISPDLAGNTGRLRFIEEGIYVGGLPSLFQTSAQCLQMRLPLVQIELLLSEVHRFSDPQLESDHLFLCLAETYLARPEAGFQC